MSGENYRSTMKMRLKVSSIQLNIIECLVYAKHYISITSLILHKFMSCVIVLLPFCRRKNWGLKLINLPKGTHLKCGARIRAQTTDSKTTLISPRGPDFKDSTCSREKKHLSCFNSILKRDLGLLIHPLKPFTILGNKLDFY